MSLTKFYLPAGNGKDDNLFDSVKSQILGDVKSTYMWTLCVQIVHVLAFYNKTNTPPPLPHPPLMWGSLQIVILHLMRLYLKATTISKLWHGQTFYNCQLKSEKSVVKTFSCFVILRKCLADLFSEQLKPCLIHFRYFQNSETLHTLRLPNLDFKTRKSRK